MSIVISAVGFGLVTAAVTALAAVGFTLQVGISNVFNFSYGAIMITGTYIGYTVNHVGGGLALTCLASAAAGALLSALANRLLFVRFIGRGINRFGMLIVCLQFAVIAKWTNDRWVATPHRVRNPEPDGLGQDRISVPFFQHPNLDALIETIPTCIAAGDRPHHPPVLWRDWGAYRMADFDEVKASQR